MSNLFDSANSMTYTENGALTYNTSSSKVLDFFGMVGGLRKAEEDRIITLFKEAFDEDPILAMKTLFYSRDIRNGGIGEKRVFRTIVKNLSSIVGDKTINREALYDAIVEYGSWKDLFESFPVEEIGTYVSEKIKEHQKTQKYDLLEKWVYSIGGKDNKKAEYLARLCGMSPKQYRKYLSNARAQIKVVEQKMCSNKWNDIEYDKVPSKASLNYRDAFKKHDEVGYNKYLADVNEGKKTIHASTLYPYEIVKKYVEANEHWWYGRSTDCLDPTLETLWNNLPDYTEGREGNALVVADVSGSMTGLPMQVSVSLAIYFAQRNKGVFKNEFITFSSDPTFVRISGSNLFENVKETMEADWGGSTNLSKTFDSILETAKRFHIPESEMPRTLYIISDMEFDAATGCGYGIHRESSFSKTVYEDIKDKYASAGYTIPSIVFWNVESRHNNLPVRRDDIGTALVSGCSPSVFKMVMTNDVNPYKVMVDMVSSFKGWGEAVEKILG